ncbi:hypothetical protein N3K66_002594 [Trichothecium roseum]|uniref:Uncharacterized protein n=1 Tax=Trichothecium roseum TaxID=47278 RepID=A0ACC0VA27_9HYPO|nr:hypothetical protein N3K66_002594 [Trichothecium roseum]
MMPPRAPRPITAAAATAAPLLRLWPRAASSFHTTPTAVRLSAASRDDDAAGKRRQQLGGDSSSYGDGGDDISSSNNAITTTTNKIQQNDQASSALPAPGRGTNTTTLDISGGGSTVKLDGLGPLVVNADGSVGRVGNWHDMTAGERETTLRILGKRNKQRLAALRAARGYQGADPGSGES